jgi:hypothetical protein
MRFEGADVRDHIVSHINDQAPRIGAMARCSPHDVFIGRYGLPAFKNTCWHYKYLGNDGGRSANMCGYTIHRVRCGDSFLQIRTHAHC